MTPLEAIQAATIQPARAFEVEAPAIAAGRVAHFIMLNGNPLDDINAFTDPVGVYTGGAWLDRGALMDIEQAARWTDLSLRAGWLV